MRGGIVLLDTLHTFLLLTLGSSTYLIKERKNSTLSFFLHSFLNYRADNTFILPSLSIRCGLTLSLINLLFYLNLKVFLRQSTIGFTLVNHGLPKTIS